MLDMEDYVKEAERQLNNKENYRKVNYDPTTVNNETIHKVVSRFQKENQQSKNISEGLKPENPKTPHFYLKPKIYKESNPGRPVISSINCHTFLSDGQNLSWLSKFSLFEVLGYIGCYFLTILDALS